MNDKSWPKSHSSTLAILAAALCVGLPIACSDDDAVGPISEGGASGGDSSSGGKGTGASSSSGGKSATGGAGGGPSSGGKSSSGGSNTGGGSTGGASSGGAANTGGVETDGGPDGSDDGGGASACSGAFGATTANLCLTFQPEAVTPVSPPTADPALNGIGTWVVTVFNKPNPASQADVIAQKYYPGPPSATQSPEQVPLSQLPSIGFNNLPPGNVYVRAYFVDNPAWFQNPTSLTWGIQAGGLNLNAGIRPSPLVRAIAVTAGEETSQNMKMWAMRKFTATVMLFPGAPANPGGNPPTPAIPPTVPADDGQGPLSIGVFEVQSPAEAAIFGGVEGRCVNVAAGPVTGVQGFFYTLATPPAAGTVMWFGAQVNDFNTTTMIQGAPGGALISLTQAQTVPPSQKATVLPTQYSVVLDNLPPANTQPSPLFLTAVNQVPDPRPASFQCPPPQPGPTDAGTD